MVCGEARTFGGKERSQESREVSQCWAPAELVPTSGGESSTLRSVWHSLSRSYHLSVSQTAAFHMSHPQPPASLSSAPPFLFLPFPSFLCPALSDFFHFLSFPFSLIHLSCTSIFRIYVQVTSKSDFRPLNIPSKITGQYKRRLQGKSDL